VVLSPPLSAWWGFYGNNAYQQPFYGRYCVVLTIGGIIACLISIIDPERIIDSCLCGIFFAESISVMLQVGYFKYTKKRFGR